LGAWLPTFFCLLMLGAAAWLPATPALASSTPMSTDWMSKALLMPNEGREKARQ